MSMNACIRLIAAALLSLHALTGAAFATNVCATPGRDLSITVTGVVNTYWSSTASVSAGATSIVLGSSTGAATSIASGDLVLIIQMQDAQFNSANSSSYGDGVAGGAATGFTALNQSGVYEFARATNGVATTGGTLQLATASGGLLNSYAHANADLIGGRGQRRYQVIRVPQYANATLGASLTAAAWDGSRGGVLAIDVAGRLDLAGNTADVTGLGFRGGGGRKLTLGLAVLTDIASGSLLSTNGSKGEGIVGTPEFATSLLGIIVDLLSDTLPGGSSARGAPGNAGGGGMDGPLAILGNTIRNSGGGGGSGYGGGGNGGHATCAAAPACGASAQNGGYGGVGVTAMASTRVLLGGGGGAGASDDGSGLSGTGVASSGAPGGGVVIIRAGVVAGTGGFIADGGAANNSVVNDGSGGGGGGGAILLWARQLEAGASLSAFARGGRGGSNTGGGTAHGPGGGGGGGYIASAVAATLDVSGGSNGTTVNGGAFGTAYGATSGVLGSSAAGLGVGLSLTGVFSGSDCAPVLEKLFETTKITLGFKTRLKVTIRNYNASASLTGAGFTDTYPAGMLNAPVPNIATTCTGTVTAAAGTNTLQLVSATIAAAASCSVWVDVTPNQAGTFLNSISAGGLVGTLVDTAVASLFKADGICDVIPPLTATKTAVTISDPQNGTTNPKAVPGAVVEYAIEVRNPTSEAAGAMALTDAIPANSSLVVSDIGVGGSGPISITQGTPSSTLTYTFTSLASLTDSLDFSNDNGVTWTYVPVAGTGGADANVTTIRARLTGTHAASGLFTLKFRVKVK